MNFDLRIPVGLMFSLFGLILIGTGVFGGAELTQKSLGINVNLWWGLFQLVFGVIMLILSYNSGKKISSQGTQPAVKDENNGSPLNKP